MRKLLTGKSVAALKAPKAGQVDVWDSKTAGFGIRVSVGGAKVWQLMYRDETKSKKRLRLGEWPAMGLADARQEARRKLGEVADGGNPAADRAAARAEPTFGEFAQVYLEHHAKVNKKPRSVHEDILMLNADLLPHWRNRKLSDIKKSDVIALLDGIKARDAKVHGNRVRNLASKIFNFAIARAIETVEYNPVHQVPRLIKEHARTHTLKDHELRRLWLALDAESVYVAAVFRLLLLTAARRGEVLGMTWDELDLDSGWWTLPIDRSKGGVEHRIPLVPGAVSLLRSLEISRRRENPFVFPGGRIGKSVNNPQKWVARIAARAELKNFRLHDIRRTVASKLTEAGVPRVTVSMLLGHVESGITGKHYDQYAYSAEKRAALLRWERRLSEIVDGKPASNVVQLHGASGRHSDA